MYLNDLYTTFRGHAPWELHPTPIEYRPPWLALMRHAKKRYVLLTISVNDNPIAE